MRIVNALLPLFIVYICVSPTNYFVCNLDRHTDKTGTTAIACSATQGKIIWLSSYEPIVQPQQVIYLLTTKLIHKYTTISIMRHDSHQVIVSKCNKWIMWLRYFQISAYTRFFTRRFETNVLKNSFILVHITKLYSLISTVLFCTSHIKSPHLYKNNNNNRNRPLLPRVL